VSYYPDTHPAAHGRVRTRHGNGGGSNRPCPLATSATDDEVSRVAAGLYAPGQPASGLETRERNG